MDKLILEKATINGIKITDIKFVNSDTVKYSVVDEVYGTIENVPIGTQIGNEVEQFDITGYTEWTQEVDNISANEVDKLIVVAIRDDKVVGYEVRVCEEVCLEDDEYSIICGKIFLPDEEVASSGGL